MPVTKYIYNPLTEAYLMETDGDGNVTARYTQEPVKYGDIHAQHRIDPATGVGKSYYYHPDALGSTRELTDESGTVVATYNYDAFGNTISSTGTVENPFRFTGNVGYYWDQDLQTYHIRARNYQPTTGRWTSQDPIGFAGGVNLYGAYFVPFNTDPSGLAPGGHNVRRYKLKKRCIFTMKDEQSQPRWDADAKRLFDISARGSALLTGVSDPFVMVAVIKSSGCCEVTMIGHRGGLDNDGISIGHDTPVFPNDQLADAMGRALAANGCSKCALRVFSCQLCKATPKECAYWGINPNILPREDAEEQAVWNNVATRTGCSVTVPTHTLLIGATMGGSRGEGHTCVPGGCRVKTGGSFYYPDYDEFTPPATRTFPMSVAK